MKNDLFLKQNKGMTIVELIVVMAILAILSTGMYSMTGVLSGRGARKTADTVMSMLSKAKVTAMGQSKGAGSDAYDNETDIYLEFCEAKNDTFGAKINGIKDDSAVRISAAGVTISAVYSTRIDDGFDPGEVTIDDVRYRGGNAGGNDGVRIAFNRKNGSLIPYKIVSNAESGTETVYYVRKLIVKQGSKQIVIRITPATGTIREEKTP